MLDINFIRENREAVQKSLDGRNLADTLNLDDLFIKDEARIAASQEVYALRERRNQIAEQIPNAGDDRGKLVAEAKELKEQLRVKEEELTLIEQEYTKLMQLVPNVLAPEVKIGKDESENEVARQVGEPTKFDFPVKDHVDLGLELDLLDIEKAAEISGSRFYYLKNEAVTMQFAIIQLVMETLTNPEKVEMLAKKAGNDNFKTFIPMLPPVMVKPEVMKKMDRLDPIDQRYVIPSDDLILVGSAEHTLGPIHMDEILDPKDLPIRYIGYSTSFRREAGTYGKDTRGILRVHQFDKLEMEVFSTAEQGPKEQALMVAVQEYLVQALGLPYQVIDICSGDMGKPDYRQIDIETWIPSQEKYRETHTSDYMTDFQARRLNTRYTDADGDKKFVHTNDATAIALSRILIAIWENYQQADGSIVVPEVLRAYMGKEVIKAK